MPAPRPSSPPTPSAILPTADDQVILADYTGHLLRYNADFTLDTSFGDSGVADLALPAGQYSSMVFDLAERPDGSLVVFASTWATGGYASAVSVYADDGTPIASFGQGGVVAGPPPSDWLGGTTLDNTSLLLAAGGLTAIRPPGYVERVYFTQDRLGSVTATVAIDDGSAVVAERYAYDPYGRRIILNGDFTLDADGQSDVASNLGLAGYHYDAATGYYHVRNRFYRADMAVWLTRDPNPAGIYNDGGSLYQYGLGTPIANSDPTGFWVASIPAAITGKAANSKQGKFNEKVREALQYLAPCVKIGMTEVMIGGVRTAKFYASANADDTQEEFCHCFKNSPGSQLIYRLLSATYPIRILYTDQNKGEASTAAATGVVLWNPSYDGKEDWGDSNAELVLAHELVHHYDFRNNGAQMGKVIQELGIRQGEVFAVRGTNQIAAEKKLKARARYGDADLSKHEHDKCHLECGTKWNDCKDQFALLQTQGWAPKGVKPSAQRAG